MRKTKIYKRRSRNCHKQGPLLKFQISLFRQKHLHSLRHQPIYNITSFSVHYTRNKCISDHGRHWFRYRLTMPGHDLHDQEISHI